MPHIPANLNSTGCLLLEKVTNTKLTQAIKLLIKWVIFLGHYRLIKTTLFTLENFMLMQNKSHLSNYLIRGNK